MTTVFSREDDERFRKAAESGRLWRDLLTPTDKARLAAERLKIELPEIKIKIPTGPWKYDIKEVDLWPLDEDVTPFPDPNKDESDDYPEGSCE